MLESECSDIYKKKDLVEQVTYKSLLCWAFATSHILEGKGRRTLSDFVVTVCVVFVLNLLLIWLFTEDVKAWVLHAI
jgi:hypothetical protein